MEWMLKKFGFYLAFKTYSWFSYPLFSYWCWQRPPISSLGYSKKKRNWRLDLSPFSSYTWVAFKKNCVIIIINLPLFLTITINKFTECGAYYLECSATLYSCHGVFTDEMGWDSPLKPIDQSQYACS